MPDNCHTVTPQPRATYRFQFNEHFRLTDALGLVPYLHELGISHIYASPLFKARPHSSHGYDVCDFSRLNPEIGTEADLERLVVALRGYGMGLLLDIVPNHMGIGGPENEWWWDVLKNGRESPFAEYFDIDWEPADTRLRGKVLVPLLGERYDHALAEKKLQLQRSNGSLELHYLDLQFPIVASQSIATLQACNTNPEALDELLRQQHFLLTFAGHGDEELNYRRFFAIATLAGVRVENERVFNEVHTLVKRWLERGLIDGLRVDHPDGLYDPQQYLERLRALAPNAWILVEKILAPDEELPYSWPVAGTTGYDFLNAANTLFVNPSAEKPLTDFYAQFTGETTDYEAVVWNKKHLVLDELLSAEVRRLTGILVDIAARYWRYRDYTWNEFYEAVAKLAACFPVYRTYLRNGSTHLTEPDASYVLRAINAARQRRAELPTELFDFFNDLLSLNFHGEREAEFVARFQQLTGAAMAKGVEDTAFYCFNRLVSLNEVGGNPAQFGCDTGSFHRFCRNHQEHWPVSLLATSTHDAKRSEDVRARLNVITEIPEQWMETVRRWSSMNEPHRVENYPDRNIEYLFYQILAGAWPLSIERAQAYMEKASCECSQHTSWKKRNKIYDSALKHFVAATLSDSNFTNDLERFASTIIDGGFVNSLAQTLIKLTCPGVPDIYQGCELWDFSLVDPDNRRPVDFGLRRRLLAHVKTISAAEAWRYRNEGLPKLWLIQRTMALRAQRLEIFGGEYQQLPVHGTFADRIIAFMRGQCVLTVAPRLASTVKNWEDTALELPKGAWLNEFTGELFRDTRIEIAALLHDFPVALLARKEAG
jgi:(1->4)-alpha-D-glucan 1-alpha-D-glucosylmutase